MKRLGVIGYPLGHTLSPVIQQAALDAVGFAARYEAWETPPEQLAHRLESLRAEDCLGANVTVPFKETVLDYLDEVEEMAALVGAVNTIVNQQGKLLGCNTDVRGFERALAATGFAAGGCSALVLGAGGAARAVVAALLEFGAGRVAVWNRTGERARRLVADLAASTSIASLDAVDDSGLREAALSAELLVNCTSVGMMGAGTVDETPLPAEWLPRGGLVMDIVYRPEETAFLRSARARGLDVLGGLPMLVHQGAASFEMWTGHEAPLDIMLAAARRVLAAEQARKASAGGG